MFIVSLYFLLFISQLIVGSFQSRYKMDKDWQKDWCMKEMAELWRCSKSRLVRQLNKLRNDEERILLKPDNIKSETEW